MSYVKKVDLKDFLREFVNQIPKVKNRKTPIICLEFKNRHDDGYFSRIDIYRIESLRIVKYKLTDSNARLTGLREWPVTGGDWRVAEIVPPNITHKVRTLRPEGIGDGSHLGIIRVDNYNG